MRKTDDDIITNWRNRKEAIRDKCEFEKTKKAKYIKANAHSGVSLSLCSVSWGRAVSVFLRTHLWLPVTSSASSLHADELT